MNFINAMASWQPPLAVMAAMVMYAASVYSVQASTYTASMVSFPGSGLTLTGVLYKPSNYDSNPSRQYPAVVMMHGCSGIWSNRVVNATNADGTPNLQNNVEKWGIKLAENNIVAIAVDSFTARQPSNVQDSKAWQRQCAGSTYAGGVNPYMERNLDARVAWKYLTSNFAVDGKKVALLGWSHGAQATLVEAAETTPKMNIPRDVSDHLFVGAVAFYPGCGNSLMFGNATKDLSFWRPFRPMQLHMGECDPFWQNCLIRKDVAVSNYDKSVEFPQYHNAVHHFDAFSQQWPESKCVFEQAGCEATSGPKGGDQCAMRSADITALSFMLSLLQKTDPAIALY
jgi:dienelactone hydrolase